MRALPDPGDLSDGRVGLIASPSANPFEIHHILRKLDRALRHYARHPAELALAFLLSLGNHFSVTACIYSIGHAFGVPSLHWLTLGAEVNYRWAGKDDLEGAPFRDSGGSILYLTPVARIELPWGVGVRSVWLRTAVQLPVTSKWLNGRQKEKEVWSVGVHVPWF